MTLEQGDFLYNRYRILDILGRGGMGSVYHAIDESLGVEVAVKENLFVTEEYEKQFRLEAVILASLRHPNLPRVTDHFTIEGQGQYLVMDYIEGRDLRHIMETGPLPEEEAVRIGIAVCDALNYLHNHKRPVLHRDIKPGNVRIAPDGHVYLVDFGLAKMSNLDEHTMSGARAMTPGYSPPEQYGTSRTDARTDVYSLGATLYAALTGFIPEDGLARVVDEIKLTPLRKRNPKISPRVASVIEKAMEPHSNNRYQSAEEIENALKGIDSANPAEQQAHAKTPSRPLQILQSIISNDAPPDGDSAVEESKKDPTRPPVKRKRRSSPVGGILFLLLIAGLGGAAYLSYIYPQQAMDTYQNLLALIISPTPTSNPTATATVKPKTTPVASKPTASPTSPKAGSNTLTATATKEAETSPAATSTETVIVAPVATNIGSGTGEIAFAVVKDNTSQIYLINTDGSNLHALTHELNGACQPSWSPDGKKLVFVSPCSGKSDLYPKSSLRILDLDTNEVTALANIPGGSFEPAWSPDGTEIAFASFGQNFLSIYKIRLADQTIIPLTTPSSTMQSRQPAWSPDGKQIVYTVKRFGILRISTMAADGSNQEQLIRNGGGSSDYLPVWSPDGTSILFSESNSELSSPASLMSFKFNATQSPQIIPVSIPVVDVDFSPDGQWIAYETNDGKDQSVLIYNFLTQKRQSLSDDSAVEFDPAWRPSQTK
jgi:serine/threonine protein kinase